MTTREHIWPGIFLAAFILSGCADGIGSFRLGGTAAQDTPQVRVQTADDDTIRPESRPQDGAARSVGGQGQRADALDRTRPEERAAALVRAASPGAVSGAELGRTLAALGNPAEPGFWLRTGLVTQVTQGRVVPVSGGDGARVELRPSGAAPGSGSQLSLAAFRAMSLPLGDLVPLLVYRD